MKRKNDHLTKPIMYKGVNLQQRLNKNRRLAQIPNRNIVRFQQTHPGGEVKSLDVVGPANSAGYAPWLLNTTEVLTALNLVTIGSSMWNRIGRKVAMRSIHFRGALTGTGNNATSTSPFYIRLMLVYDKQSNGALPNISDVVQDQTTGATDQHTTNVWSGLNLNNRDRFEVIWDKQFAIAPANTNTGVAGNTGLVAGPDELQFNYFQKLRNREVHYKADSAPAVIGDVSTGALVFITFGSVASGTEPYQLNGAFRLRYSDL